MILYLDTSAFVKLYVDEPGSVNLREALARAKAVYTHQITYVEIRAAFAKIHGMKRISVEALESIKQAFEQDWMAIGVIGVNESLIRRAGDLAEILALRGYDSVHLAATEALHVQKSSGTDFCFAGFDQKLNQGASRLGIALLKI
jgi:predicted nucleic acid-binding protein